MILGGIVFFLSAIDSPTIVFKVLPDILWVLAVLIFIVIFFLFQAWRTYRHRDFEFMIVGVESKKALRVIENALDSKNFPFVRFGTEFRLKTEGLVIKVMDPIINSHAQSTQSSIWIGPISKSNFEITQSLKANIEDGFQLKGLS